MKEWFIDKDLNKVLYCYIVDPKYLTQEQKDQLNCSEDDDYIRMNGADIEYYDIDYDAVDWCFPEEDDDYFIEENLFPKNRKYLVWASGCRWDGASGYKFSDDFYDAISRSYDNTQYIKGQSKGRKVLYVSEHSHDVPMGGSTKYIALTDREYERLKNAEWKTVEKFASQF